MSSVRPRKTGFKLFFPLFIFFYCIFVFFLFFVCVYFRFAIFCFVLFFFLIFIVFIAFFLTLFRSHLNCYLFYCTFAISLFKVLYRFPSFPPLPFSCLFSYFSPFFPAWTIFSLSPFPASSMECCRLLELSFEWQVDWEVDILTGWVGVCVWFRVCLFVKLSLAKKKYLLCFCLMMRDVRQFFLGIVDKPFRKY